MVAAITARLGTTAVGAARSRRRRGRARLPRRAGRRRPPTSSSRTGTSVGPGRARTTSVERRPRRTSPTSSRWAPAPTALLVGLAVPGDLPVSWGLELADGLARRGGDARRGSDRRRPHPVRARGDLGHRARRSRRCAPRSRGPAQSPATSSRCADGSAGPRPAVRCWPGVSARRAPSWPPTSDRSPRTTLGRRPPPLGAHALIDVSDGLIQDLGHIAVASGVSIDLDGSAFDPDPPIRDVGAALGVDPQTFVLTGGEDHALAACFPADVSCPSGGGSSGGVSTARQRSPSTVSRSTRRVDGTRSGSRSFRSAVGAADVGFEERLATTGGRRVGSAVGCGDASVKSGWRRRAGRWARVAVGCGDRVGEERQATTRAVVGGGRRSVCRCTAPGRSEGAGHPSHRRVVRLDAR